MFVDKPKYLQIKDELIDFIKDKEPNTPIPSEREIATNTDASRMTVRRAVEELVSEGYLYRDKNVGTFVADRKIRVNNNPITSGDGDTIEYKILYFNMYYEVTDNNRDSNKDIIENLDIEPGDLFLRVIRLAMKQKDAICIEEIYVARNNFRDEDINYLNTFLDIDKYIREGRTTQVFIPIIVPEKYANLLQVKLNTPIIQVDNLISKMNGEPFIYMKSYYNPFHKKIEITL